MGGLSSLFGKPKTVEATEMEKTLGRIATEQGEYYKTAFMPVLRDAEALARLDRSSVLRGRTNADVMQNLGSAVGTRTLGMVAAGAKGLSTGLTGATRAAKQDQFNKGHAAVMAGMGNASGAIEGLGQAGNAATSSAISEMNKELAEYQQNLDMAGTAIGAAGALGVKYMDTKKAMGEVWNENRSFGDVWFDPNKGRSEYMAGLVNRGTP